MRFKFLKKLGSGENRLILLILLLAAFLRLYRIADYMEFLGDQGRDVIIVSRFLKKGDLMFIGPQTSIGNMYLGPWYYYFISPALFLANFNPVGPAVMVVLTSLVAIWLIWRAGRAIFDRQTGLLAALIFTLSPVVIYYSIFSWNPNIMPLFSLLSVWFTWLVWKKDDWQKIPWLGFCLAMALNSHYLGLLLFPAIGFFLLLKLLRVRKDQERLKPFLLFSLKGLIIFLVLMAPLLLFDLKHNFVNFKAIYQFFSLRQTTVNLKVYKGLLKLPVIVNQLLANLFVKKDAWAFSYWLVLPLLLAFWKERRNKGLLFLSLFLAIGLLGLANYKQHIYAHYFGFLWPVAVLMIAFLLRRLFPYSGIIVLLLVWLMVLNWHGWQEPGYQLDRARKVADFILEKSGGERFALALIAERNYDPPYRYFLDLAEAPVVDLHQEMPSQLFVICEPGGKVDCRPIGHSLWEIAAFGWAKIDQEWPLAGVKVFKLVHYEDDNG